MGPVRWVIWSLVSVTVLAYVPPSLHPQKAAVEHGDIVLGGLFPIHMRGERTFCGAINKDRGIQRLEAMLFAIDRINRDPSLLPNITLGALIVDTCSLDTYALNQSLEFIRASINTMDVSGFECSDGKQPRQKQGKQPVYAVIGASITSVSIQVANLLRLFRIPQISPASTGEPLSDKSRFDFFARTVPPDNFQTKALVDIVESFKWSYISTVASGGQYGEAGMDSFHKEARARNICIAVTEKVPRSADKAAYDQILLNLKNKPNARGVVLFVSSDDARGILEAIQRAKMHDNYTWIASDGWGSQGKLVEGVEEAAEGAITVELESRTIDEFDAYMRNLTPATNFRNPWFREYWEEFFMCSLEEFDSERNSSRLPTCSDSLRLDVQSGWVQESKVQFVVDAVYAMAHALHNLYTDVCPKRNGVCPEMRAYDGGEFFKKYILNVSFQDMAGSDVYFDKQGDGLGRYTILNYQRIPNSSTYDYKVVGKWFSGLINLTTENIIYTGGSKELPVSVCSRPCKVGEVKVMQHGESCCWLCQKCQPHEYVYDNFTCWECGLGRWPYPHKRSCYDLEQLYMKWDSLFAIVPMCISCFGALVTASVIALFVKYNDTPVVKASGRELSYMLLAGILVCYVMTFVLLAKPSASVCGLQRFGVGFGFSIVYGSLLTKTNRISRIFDSASKSARRPGFISPRSQVVITIILISVQVIGTVVWLIIEPPSTRVYSPDGRLDRVILKCRIQDSSFLVSLAYNMFLITTCTVYAVKTRKIPENFNESKFIGFTMYTTCIIWLAFVPIYFGTGNSFEIQITTLCVSVSLSASVALVCLYSPKIYIIVFHPDKNVRKLTMNSATYKKAATSSTTCGTSANHGGSAEHVKMAERALAPLTVSSTKCAADSERDSLTSM